MMNSAAAFFQKFRNRRIFRCRLQQFDTRFANRQHRHAHFLIFDNFRMDIFQSERVFPKFQSFVNSFCRNA